MTQQQNGQQEPAVPVDEAPAAPSLEERRHELESRLRGLFGNVVVKGLLCAVGLGLAFTLLWKLLVSPVSDGLKEPGPGGAAQPAEVASVPPDPRALERLHEQQEQARRARVARELAKAAYQRAARDGERALREIDALTADIERVEKDAAALLRDDRGKLLAGDPSLVRRFRAARGEKRPARDTAEGLKEELETLLKPVKAALEEGTAHPPGNELLQALDGVARRVEQARASCDRAQTRVAALLAEAKRSGVSGAVTLEAAVAGQAQEEALKETASLDAAVQKARDQARKKVEAARADEVRQAEEAEAERIRRETEERRVQAEREAKQKATLARAKRYAAVWLRDVPTEERRVRSMEHKAGFWNEHSSAMDRNGVPDAADQWRAWDKQCAKEFGFGLHGLWKWQQQGWPLGGPTAAD